MYWGPSSQSYGFSSSYGWMWELDYKESWVPKNWSFWTVVLEKTLKSPLDCKEIQPVHPKGNHSSRSVVSDSLWPHGLQHARLPCPSPNPRAHSNSCPSSRWCHPNISSSVTSFSSCPQSFPPWGFFPLSQLLTSGGHSIRALASASVLMMNIQD